MIVKRTYRFDEQDNEEIRLIAECTHLSAWNTGKNKRKLRECFNEEEIEIIEKISNKCYRWYTKTGITENAELTEKEFDVWGRLVQFCAMM